MRRFLARVTVPKEGSSCPMRMRRSVVLPIPLGPTSARRAPFATEKDTLAKRSSAPKDLEREFAIIRDIFRSGAIYCVSIYYLFVGFSASSAHLDGLDSI